MTQAKKKTKEELKKEEDQKKKNDWRKRIKSGQMRGNQIKQK